MTILSSHLQRPLLKRLYYIPDAPKLQSQGTTYVNIEGYLEKLPSGRKKATFWNAWKRRYFMAKNGILYYYQVRVCLRKQRSALRVHYIVWVISYVRTCLVKQITDLSQTGGSWNLDSQWLSIHFVM